MPGVEPCPCSNLLAFRSSTPNHALSTPHQELVAPTRLPLHSSQQLNSLPTASTMGDLGNFTDFPSPPNSMYYVYGDHEPYLSESQSPNNSAVSVLSLLIRGAKVLIARFSMTLPRETAGTQVQGTRKENLRTHQSSKNQQPSGSERTATRTPLQPCCRYVATPHPATRSQKTAS